MNQEELLELAVGLARDAGALLLERFQGQVTDGRFFVFLLVCGREGSLQLAGALVVIGIRLAG